MQHTLTFCGCGWLGQHAIAPFQHKGFSLRGTRQQQTDADVLSDHGVQGITFSLEAQWSAPQLQRILNVDTLILNIPPGRKRSDWNSYIRHMCALIDHCRSTDTRVLFVSTTAVYGEIQGVVTEHSPSQPVTASGQAHVAIEQHLMTTLPNRATVLRLSGLTGPDRHPARSLSGRHVGGNPAQVVNLIHSADVIRAMLAIVEQQYWGHTLHLAATQHPRRDEYYTWACQQLGMPLPTFDLAEDAKARGKHIDCQHTLEQLSLNLQYPTPYDMIG
ncbi:NAD-dependent epimerase/dehydratase family protein [Aestuariibacter halophilus]|uniref:NAD-dependent epimerase/dehydratase family protein n=1 Tax=Fluctibacter halophilus TaxID=226011 RepID=A0ABS8GBI3_9ALTE|nr:NAD-dependent epimerase/dehydratase family protein [Aestuariibacter halophilus]MCC2617863.1 NAD-dependent epimerase/dehydratase family protein [Aestuariibacter halophilus]